MMSFPTVYECMIDVVITSDDDDDDDDDDTEKAVVGPTVPTNKSIIS